MGFYGDTRYFHVVGILSVPMLGQLMGAVDEHRRFAEDIFGFEAI